MLYIQHVLLKTPSSFNRAWRRYSQNSDSVDQCEYSTGCN